MSSLNLNLSLLACLLVIFIRSTHSRNESESGPLAAIHLPFDLFPHCSLSFHCLRDERAFILIRDFSQRARRERVADLLVPFLDAISQLHGIYRTCCNKIRPGNVVEWI